MNRPEIRAEARKFLGDNIFSSNWIIALLTIFLTSIVISASEMVFVGPILLTGPMNIGLVSAFLIAYKSNTEVDIGTLFSEAFDDFLRKFLVGLMQAVFLCLWTMLFIIPGFIKAYSYSMTFYIAAEHPEYDWKQCITESRRIMDGNKFKLLLLDLSFIGWYCLGFMAFGVGTLWVSAYHRSSRMIFYKQLVGDNYIIE